MNGEGIPNDIMPEDFGSIVMFATNMKAATEDCTKVFDPDYACTPERLQLTNLNTEKVK